MANDDPSSCALTIEQARTADADALLKLCHLAYQSEAEIYNDWSIPPLLETRTDLLAVLEDATVLVVRRAGEVIGSVRGHLRGQVVEVGRLVVHPRLQRNGIGTALLETIEAHFPQAICFELFTGHLSEGNLRLYARHGYREVRREILSPVLTMVVMEKRRPERRIVLGA